MIVFHRVGCFLLICVVACTPFESAKDISGLVALDGKCVRLRRSLLLVDSGGGELAPAFLSNAVHSKGVVAEIPAGTVVHLGKSFLVKSFEDTRIVVIGRIGGSSPSASVTQLFDWRWRNELRSSFDRDEPRGADLTTALDPTLAEWCTAEAKKEIRPSQSSQ